MQVNWIIFKKHHLQTCIVTAELCGMTLRQVTLTAKNLLEQADEAFILPLERASSRVQVTKWSLKQQALQIDQLGIGFEENSSNWNSYKVAMTKTIIGIER